jgi:hypothetical protein
MRKCGGSGALVAAGVIALSAVSPARPVKLTPTAAKAAVKAIGKDRADTEKWLRSDPTSYLAAVDRRDFEDKKTLTVGRAVDNDVRIDDATVAAHHLRVTVQGDAFHVEALDRDARFAARSLAAPFTLKDHQQRDATIGPSSIHIGRFDLALSHQGYPAIIVFDPKSPGFKKYKGLTYFPIDLASRYELPLTPNPRPETVIIMSTRGNKRNALRVGWFDFMVGDAPCRLEVNRLLEPGIGENDLSILYRDATTGTETYSVGRYVDPKKLPNGNYLLDFNFAYNPACAVSDYYNCPIPPKDNTLTVAIRAGEMDSHYH